MERARGQQGFELSSSASILQTRKAKQNVHACTNCLRLMLRFRAKA